MRKSQIIPKVCAAAVFLIIALIVSIPVSSIVLNRFFGGGIVEFGKAGSVEYLENRPVEGVLHKIIACSNDDNGDDNFTLKSGTYYYLVSLTGDSLKKDDTEDVILLKTTGGSSSYEELNDLWRRQSSADEPLSVSGIIKKSTPAETKIVEQICKDENIKNTNYIDYSIDCSKPVSRYTARFLISLIFYAGFIISLLLSVQSIKKNRDIDDIEHRRAIMQASKDVKSGDNNSGGADAMFGDDDRSYVSSGTQYQGQGESPTVVSQNLERQAAEQYQGTPQNFNQDNQFFGQQESSDDKYDGFFGS